MKHVASQTLPPGLYLVATPIGNLKDITLRALEVLGAVDVIYCEDTRESAKLLSHYGIATPTRSYNDHNGAAQRPAMLRALAAGQRLALISDAGTPLVSDPGYKLVVEAQAQGIHVTTLPGASSVLAALSLSGLPSDRFLFAGFLPTRSDARKAEIAALAPSPATLIWFEAARRLPETLSELLLVLGDRPAAVVREITKRFEESRRGLLSELCAHYAEAGEPKGEVVVLVGAAEKKSEITDDEVLALLRVQLREHRVKDAASIVAAHTGMARKQVYALALSLGARESHDE